MTIIECMFSISPIPKPGDNNDSIIYNYMLSHKERRLPLVMKGPDPTKGMTWSQGCMQQPFRTGLAHKVQKEVARFIHEFKTKEEVELIWYLPGIDFRPVFFLICTI